MFCNQKTDWLGPQHLTNKAATRVKKTTIAMGSPEQIMIEDLDEVNVPEVAKIHIKRRTVLVVEL